MFMEVETCISGYFVVYRGGGKAIGQYSNGISVYLSWFTRVSYVRILVHQYIKCTYPGSQATKTLC